MNYFFDFCPFHFSKFYFFPLEILLFAYYTLVAQTSNSYLFFKIFYLFAPFWKISSNFYPFCWSFHTYWVFNFQELSFPPLNSLLSVSVTCFHLTLSLWTYEGLLVCSLGIFFSFDPYLPCFPHMFWNLKHLLEAWSLLTWISLCDLGGLLGHTPDVTRFRTLLFGWSDCS